MDEHITVAGHPVTINHIGGGYWGNINDMSGSLVYGHSRTEVIAMVVEAISLVEADSPILDRIDQATVPRCATCSDPLPPNTASIDWCSPECQHTWHSLRATDPVAVYNRPSQFAFTIHDYPDMAAQEDRAQEIRQKWMRRYATRDETTVTSFPGTGRRNPAGRDATGRWVPHPPDDHAGVGASVDLVMDEVDWLVFGAHLREALEAAHGILRRAAERLVPHLHLAVKASPPAVAAIKHRNRPYGPQKPKRAPRHIDPTRRW